jgi:hypothetical protein
VKILTSPCGQGGGWGEVGVDSSDFIISILPMESSNSISMNR